MIDGQVISQTMIALLGVTAVALSQSSLLARRKWACVFGLMSQPFWFWTSYESQQWGIFALCFLYALSWAKGFHNHWLAKPAASESP